MTRTIEQRWAHARQHLERREVAPARAQLEIMRAQAPHDVRTHLLAAQMAWRDHHVRAATSEALAAARAVPEDPSLLCDTIDALWRVGEVVAMRECLARPALASAATPAWWLRSADFRQRLNENDAALDLLRRAIAAGANDPETRFHYGAQLYFHARFDEAATELEACLSSAPELGRAAWTLASIRTQTRASQHLARLGAGLARVAPGSLDHAALEFARYREWEDLGQYRNAWASLSTANAIMHARNPVAVEAEVAFLDALIATCDGAWLRPRAAGVDGPQPIFIVGLPRSGTTMLERMLGNHSLIESAGELVAFGTQLQWLADTRNIHSAAYLARLRGLDLPELGERYLAQTRWRARGKPFFIDKQPPNWEVAGLIAAALPGARILSLSRAPIDVCFSDWRAFFGDAFTYSYDLAALAPYHRAYQRVMAHWRRLAPDSILDVPHAELVSAPERTLRRVFAFCGLEWEPGCVDMRRNPVASMTLSAAQVRQSIDGETSGRWRRYATQLQPLIRGLSAGGSSARP